MSEVLCHSPESKFTGKAQSCVLYNEFENNTFKITATSPRGYISSSMHHMDMSARQWRCASKDKLTKYI